VDKPSSEYHYGDAFTLVINKSWIWTDAKAADKTSANAAFLHAAVHHAIGYLLALMRSRLRATGDGGSAAYADDASLPDHAAGAASTIPRTFMHMATQHHWP
jgi:hypothetical protein